MSLSNTSRIRPAAHGPFTGTGAFAHSGAAYLASNAYAPPGKLYSFMEQLFVVLLLLSSMNVVTALSPSSSKAQNEIRVFSADVDTFSVMMDAGVYIYGGLLALMRWRRVLRAARTAWPLLSLAAFACLSTLWSVQPMLTLRRSVLLLAATIIAIYVGERYSLTEFARLLTRTLCLMMAMVAALYFVAPGYVIDYSAYGGAWKGLSAYKNTFGEHMAVAALLLALIRFGRFSWMRYVFLFLAAGLLFLSRSATAVVCGGLSIAAAPLWRLTRGRQRLLIYLLIALAFCMGFYWILAFPETVFQLLGRDATLTGRTDLWTMLLPVIANRPVLGYGYAVFWTGSNPDAISVWIQAGRLAPIADNGYIDLCLGLGAIGLCVFLYVFIQAFGRAIKYLTAQPGSIGLWPVTYLCIFAADNICESALLTRGTFPFLVFAVLATSLALSHKHSMTTARTADHQPAWWALNPPLTSR
jgi:exopolysaccharide production protein ExoQ